MSKIPILPDQYYHIYNCGVNYRKIFFTPANWQFFLVRLRDYFTSEHADIISYCLMPNHYHLLIHAKSTDFSSKIMQPLGTSYTKAINKQENRIGALFQGPFQARLIIQDSYLLHLSRYIHLNPVAAGYVRRPEEWEYSSFREYSGFRNGTLPKPLIILSQFMTGSPTENPDGEPDRRGLALPYDRLRNAHRAYAEFVNEKYEPGAELPEALLMDWKL